MSANAHKLALLRLQLFTSAQTLTGPDLAELKKLVAEIFITLDLSGLSRDELFALAAGEG